MRPRVVIYTGSPQLRKIVYGRVPEWPRGTDGKSAAFQLRWFESTRAHEKTAGVEIHWRFSFAQMSDSHRRVDLNSIGRRYTSRRQKGPCGAFLDARLATSTRAHQTRKIRTCFRLEKGSDFSFSWGMIAIRIFNSLATTANCMPQ